MKIGFDAKRYFHNRTGLGNYSRDLVDTLGADFPEHQYFLFDKSPSTLDLPAHTIAVVPIGNKLLWRASGMIQDVKRFQLDIFHGLSNELPWGKWPSHVKKIVTIHDVIFRHFPEQYGIPDRWVYEKKTRHALKIADTVIATSHATAKDLMDLYQADEKKIQVVYQTCGQGHWRNHTAQNITDFRNRQQLNKPFILYVSSFQKRKNHMALLNGLKANNNRNIQLVLAGKPKETYAECVAYVKNNGLEQQVRFITDIGNAELPLLYRSAQSFIYPSMVEGFGIPLIEAACAGLPMAANDIDVFREIAPQDTLFFDSENPEMTAGVLSELSIRTLMDHHDHLRIFTPGYAAARMMEIYRLDNL